MADIQFASAKDAVRWAEEVASIPDIGSQLGKLLMKPGTSTLTRADARDIAQTISTITAAACPPGGYAMKCVYAGHNMARDDQIGALIGDALHRQEPGRTKPHTHLIRLGTGTVIGERTRELYGMRFPLQALAFRMGVSKDALARDDDWRILRRQAIQQLRDWLLQASRQITLELQELEWLK